MSSITQEGECLRGGWGRKTFSKGQREGYGRLNVTVEFSSFQLDHQKQKRHQFFTVIMGSVAWRQKEGWIRQAPETDFQDDGKVVHFMFAFNLGIMTPHFKPRSKSHGI